MLPMHSNPVSNGHYGESWPDVGYVGPNGDEQAEITYYLKQRVNSGNVKVEIYDDKGNFLVDIPGTKRKGINVVDWNMRVKPPRVAQGGSKADWTSTVGPMVLEGKYKVKVVIGNESAEGVLSLVKDTLTPISEKDRKENYDAVMRAFQMQDTLATLMDSVIAEEKRVKDLRDLSPVIKEYYDSLESVRATLVPVKEGRTVIFVDEQKIRDKVSDIYAGVNFYEGQPTTSQEEGLTKLQQDIKNNEKKLEERKQTFRPRIREILQGLGKNVPY